MANTYDWNIYVRRNGYDDTVKEVYLLLKKNIKK